MKNQIFYFLRVLFYKDILQLLWNLLGLQCSDYMPTDPSPLDPVYCLLSSLVEWHVEMVQGNNIQPAPSCSAFPSKLLQVKVKNVLCRIIGLLLYSWNQVSLCWAINAKAGICSYKKENPFLCNFFSSYLTVSYENELNIVGYFRLPNCRKIISIFFLSSV